MMRRGGTSRGRKAWALVAFAALVTSAVAAMSAPSSADLEAGHVDVVQLDGSQLNKCTGAMPTPGSENTDKRLVGGTLVPGGTAVFEFTYPFDPTDTSGRQDFVILDCVFVNDEPALAFELHGVPNDVSPFIFQFTVDIPSDIPIGAEFCNVGKTTAAPSSAQASNRKAGPACFVVGGDLRVVKVDAAGAPLMGATFAIECTPSSELLPVVIEGVTADTYTGSTGSDNVITIAGPLGTSCVITETAAPAGYAIASPASVTAVIGVDGPEITVVDPRATGDLAITKVSDTPGTFTFTVDCPGTAVTAQQVSVTVATAGGPGTTSAAITGIPTGTVCTITEATAAGFEARAPQTVTIGLGTNTVTFTNVHQVGTLVVAKTTVGGTGSFNFNVDCNPGTGFDQTITLTNTETRRIAGIPTGTTCTVTEAASALFTSVVTPTNGTVVIATGDNLVSFTNTARPPALTITKVADAATVTAGTGVGFTVTVANTGSGPATAVTLDDPLPAASGVNWAISPAYAGPGMCSITGTAPAQRLVCSFGTMAPSASATVHVSSATTATTSGTLTNTATAVATNHPAVSATAAVTVQIPPVVLGTVITAPPVVAAAAPVAPPAPVAAPPAAPAPAPVVAGETLLPRTGTNGLAMTIAGLALVALGVVFRRWGARRRVPEVGYRRI
ncbi:MAG TPA: DUF5979 domain-containing protein [Acidimicrobiales bacterium]|nr:DUF5979 domain-containing protein [Acidimicrobiales bacterium]